MGSWRLALWVFVVTTALAYTAHPAQAARISVLARGAGPGSDRVAALIGHYARESFARDERYEVVLPTGASQDLERARALRSFSQADELFSQAREAYDHLDLDAADKTLRGALRRYEHAAGYVNDFKKVSDLFMLAGAVAILKGDTQSGNQALAQALNIYPKSEPDARIFNPSMRAQFAQVASHLNDAAPGALAVSSSPGYAEVYIDGQFGGITPAVLDKLSPGIHFVRLDRPGQRPWGRIVNIAPRKEVTLSADLRETRHFELLDLRLDDAMAHTGEEDKEKRTTIARDRRDLANLADAEQVFIARVRLLGERVQVTAELSDRDGTLKHNGSHTFAYDSHMQTFEHEVDVLLQKEFGLGTAAVAVSPPALSQAERDADTRTVLPHAGSALRCGKFNCRHLKYAVATSMLVAGIAGLTVGSVEYALAAHSHRSWQRVIQISPEMGTIRAKGRQQALLGDVMMGVGGALVLAGSLTFRLWHPSPSLSSVSGHGHDPGAVELSPQSRLELQVLPCLASRGGMVEAAFHF